VLIAAFAGWNDAGRAATFALHSLQRSWSAARFAEIDAEEFSISPKRDRSLIWAQPGNVVSNGLKTRSLPPNAGRRD
jgi:hypothetical protein